MHIAEETFHTIRMSQMEYARLAAEISVMLRDGELDITDYPLFNRFASCVGYAGGDSPATVFDETPEEEPEYEVVFEQEDE